jgi:hypothetical protein
MALPAMRHKRYFLDFAFPFAMQAPFLGEDLYGKYSMVEPSEAYCCPPSQWWARLRPVLLSLTDSRPIYVVTAGAGTEALVVLQRTISATALKERIAKVLSRPLDSPLGISWNDADRISEVFFPGVEAPQ